MAGAHTVTTIELPEPGMGCRACNYEGMVLYVYPRGPRDAPGNQVIPCPECSAGGTTQAPKRL